VRFLFILSFCIVAFTATEVFAQREMPAYGDPTKLQKHQPDPSQIPPGYKPPKGGVTDLQIMQQNKREMARRVEMSCSTKAIYSAYRTTIQRGNKYYINDPDNEYLFVMDGLIPVPHEGYSFTVTLEKVKKETAFLRLTISPPAVEKEDILKVPMKMAVNTKTALGKNPITAVVILVEGLGIPSKIECNSN